LVGFIFDVMLDLISVLFLITPALALQGRAGCAGLWKLWSNKVAFFRAQQCIFYFFIFFLLALVDNFRFLLNMVKI